jgi:hypothetical protein
MLHPRSIMIDIAVSVDRPAGGAGASAGLSACSPVQALLAGVHSQAQRYVLHSRERVHDEQRACSST